MLIGEVVDELGTPNDFIGHAGGDNFIIITQEAKADAMKTRLKERFDTIVLDPPAFAKFVALAKKGKPRDAWKAPQGVPREQALKLREKDKQIDALKGLVEEMKRKSEQGSQERQGEVLELDIQERLTALFKSALV